MHGTHTKKQIKTLMMSFEWIFYPLYLFPPLLSKIRPKGTTSVGWKFTMTIYSIYEFLWVHFLAAGYIFVHTCWFLMPDCKKMVIISRPHSYTHIGVAARINSIALYIFYPLCATIINLFLSFIFFYDPTSGHDSGQVVRRSRDHPLTIKTSICHHSE